MYPLNQGEVAAFNGSLSVNMALSFQTNLLAVLPQHL